MAQSTSELWKTLLALHGTVREYAFDIDGVWYGPESEMQHSAENALYEEFGIGNAYNAILALKIVADSIPRSATIKRYVRLRNENQVSEWLPKGVFFVNKRSEEDGVWEVEAFDAMCKAEQKYLPDVVQSDWPIPMSDAVNEIAERMGVSIDARTVINSAYMLQYPVDYTMRQVLGHIAAAHGGNWVITDVGELYLVPLLSAPDETHYLVNEYGEAITFGGARILV